MLKVDSRYKKYQDGEFSINFLILGFRMGKVRILGKLGVSDKRPNEVSYVIII